MEHDIREDIFVITWHGLPLLPLSRVGRAYALGQTRAISRHFYTAKPVNTAFYISTTTTTKTTKELTLWRYGTDKFPRILDTF